jgi:hypothetical protein
MHTDKLKNKELTHLIIKDFFEVYTESGGGFLESVDENAMTLALQQGLQLETQRLLMNFGNELTSNGSFTINSKSNLFNPCLSVAK